MSSFKVVSCGLLSLIEDFGRFGLSDKGITNSGVMDEYAYIILNKLLQNSPNTNCIEITLGGLKLEVDDTCTIAVTGADANFSINSKKVDIWRTHNLKKGDLLEFGFAKKGARVYFSIKGGFDIKKELGSYSATLKENIGKNLQSGDILKFCDNNILADTVYLKKEFIPIYETNLTLRVVLGYQNDFFTQEEIDKFFKQSYTISSQNNRMGYRLESQPIQCKIDGIISEGISFGAIQIPKDGQPIILLKERQTIGGYPKIGSVLPIDCFKLSQLRAGDSISFEQINIEEAQEKMRLFNSLTLQI
ncbi:MAG: biotin-dependent carboxyltransferase family protein [Campylobacteraceae bacterium]|nr:biotin-dependent carboxyltransferase family protein [Campylobacteraceae bacterium]